MKPGLELSLEIEEIVVSTVIRFCDIIGNQSRQTTILHELFTYPSLIDEDTRAWQSDIAEPMHKLADTEISYISC